MTAPSPCTWLALCIATESDDPLEQYHVAWAIRNRVERRGRWPDTYYRVVTQRMQFSFFDSLQPFDSEQADYHRCVLALARARGDQVLDEAMPIAREVLHEDRWRAPFNRKTDHFWSPVSMKPVGREPSWAKRLHRTFTPSGIDPARFVFGQERA